MSNQIAFWCCAVLVVIGALLTITRRNTISAVMALVLTFFALAAVYTLLSAHFLAVVQVLVYAGAIMTLFVFVVMVLNREEQEPWALRGIVTKAVGLGALGYLMMRMAGFLFTRTAARLEAPPADWGGVHNVGELLFTDYLFPFEAISLTLLVAVIGAVVVARMPHPHAQQAANSAPEQEHAE